MFTPTRNPVLTLKYVVLVGLVGGLMLWQAQASEWDLSMWVLPVAFVVIWFFVDRQEYTCPECGKRWALRVKGEFRLGDEVEYICRGCWSDYDPYRGGSHADHGDHPPARGIVKVICLVLIGAGCLLLVMTTLMSAASAIGVVMPFVMIGLGVARLKGWIRFGGHGGGGGAP